MLSRCSRILSLTTLALVVSTLFSGVVVAADEKGKLGNNTIDRTLQLRTHSLYAPYIDQDLQNRWWDFGADSYVNTNKHIRLTRNVPSQMGWLWSRLAITVTNFVIEVEFKVSGDSSHLFGDGLAMWLTSERAEPGPVFGNKDEFTGLGILLDTYANARHSYSFPRIVGVLGDGKTKYNFGNDGDDQAIGACSANFRRTNVVTKLKVTYVKNGFLDVKVQYKAWDQWEDCFYIEKFELPSNPFLGFSAMTGDVSDAHDIIAVTSWSAILSQPDAPLNKHKKSGFFGNSSHADELNPPGTWLGFFFKLFLLAGVIGGGYYGWKEYQRKQRYGGFGGGMGDFGPPTPRGGAYGMRTPGANDGFGNIYGNTKRF
ncbi:ERGIC53, mannose lectin, ER-golgi intermediate compartment [Crepidotus variabilis]|uniref:ERGIC53, mannose lectin, ER-golgi intermediate compartment n=1 Tax=Crepidotus variabilis TaxID=179855 RepID=A0A9P6EIN3_9AGAR|nr:ERGIC53, mannose lectin, ER-golgi intermediate compartment [Crepidotus variabilis]